MATQLRTNQPDPAVEAADPPVNDAAVDTATTETESERDYEAEARERGWRPLEEFKGDPASFVDAKTYVERAETVLPLVKAENARLKRDLSELKRQFRQMSKHMTGAEERIRSELLAGMEKAVEAGDLTKFRELKKQEEGLDKPGGSGKYTEQDLIDAYDQLRDDNPWYDRAALAGASDAERDARVYFDRTLERKLKGIKPGEEPPPDELLSEVMAGVREKHPAVFSKAAPRQKPASDVAAGGVPGRRGNARTWDNLPPEVKARFEKWEKQGMKRDVLLSSFDWDGYAKEAAR